MNLTPEQAQAINDRMGELHRELERFAREAGKALANLGAHLAAMFSVIEEAGRE